MSDKLESVLGVVFGHYDSRGGTMFLTIPDSSEASVREAMRRYNKDVFDYDEDTDMANGAGIGRACDIIVDALCRDGDDPATCDFMYVARLHYREGTLEHGTDLTEIGAVFVEGADHRHPEMHPDWTGGPCPEYHSSAFGNGPHYGTPEYEAANAPYNDWQERWNSWVTTAPYPVFNLEFVRFSVAPLVIAEGSEWDGGSDADWEQYHTDQLTAANTLSLTPYGKAATSIPRWDDDAFGFVIWKREEDIN